MSVKYSVAQMRNPQRPDETPKFYARAQIREEVDINQIAEEIAWSTTLTEGDVVNVLKALIRKLREHLNAGDMVSLGDFGKFQYQISSDGADTYEEVIAANIRKVRIQFRPGKLIKDSLNGLSFERVISVKARKEAAKKEREEATPEEQTNP